MVVWLILTVMILVGIAIVTFCITVYSYMHTLGYLGVDKVKLIQHIKARDRDRANEVILERLGQLIGLTLWRIYNNLKVFPTDEQETRNDLDVLKNMSAKILAVDWEEVVRKNAEDGSSLILSGRIVLHLSHPETDQEKKAAAAVREDAEELEHLQRITGVMLVKNYFEMSVKIKLVEK